MALELAEVIGSFPFAASFAIAGGISLFREGRRRSSLNEAMHELRRPLQVLALSLPADAKGARALDSSLRMAAAAVDRLDHEINGRRLSEASAPVALRPVVEAAVERWRARATNAGRPLNLEWSGGSPLLRGDGLELDQAVDNMISNALEHGGGEVTVEVREKEDRLDVVVLDDGSQRPPSQRRRRQPLRVRLSGRNRHGHGLKVVRRAAARHDGSFKLRRSSHRTEARLELPLEEGGR